MSASKVKETLLRLRCIQRNLERRDWSTEELVEKLSIFYSDLDIEAKLSEDTIKRAIKILTEEFGYAISFVKSSNKWHLDTGIRPNDDWEQVEKLIQGFELLTLVGADSAIPPYVQIEHYEYGGLEHLMRINKAIRHQRSLYAVYHKYQSSQEEERKIIPLLIKQWRGRWYLIGEDCDKRAIRSFSLDRIKTLTLGAKEQPSQTYPKLRERYANSYGIYASESYEIEHIVLEFDREDAAYLDSRPLHHSQKIERIEGKDRVRLSLDLCITKDFLMELMSRAWSLRVVEPASLRDRLCEVWREALARNTDSPKL